MASKINPEVEIELDKKRHLRLDLNAMAAYEEATGKSLFRGIEAEEMGAREMRAILWACLIHEDPELTIEQVGSWIDMNNMGDIATRISEAFENAMPDNPEEEG